MGMFDTVCLEAPLPDEGEALRGEAWWQTKDLACCGDVYTIIPEGRLLDDGNRDTCFDGSLNFYTMDDDDKWYEYYAIFRDGNLVRFDRAPAQSATESREEG